MYSGPFVTIVLRSYKCFFYVVCSLIHRDGGFHPKSLADLPDDTPIRYHVGNTSTVIVWKDPPMTKNNEVKLIVDTWCLPELTKVIVFSVSNYSGWKRIGRPLELFSVSVPLVWLRAERNSPVHAVH